MYSWKKKQNKTKGEESQEARRNRACFIYISDSYLTTHVVIGQLSEPYSSIQPAKVKSFFFVSKIVFWCSDKFSQLAKMLNSYM